MKRIDTEMPREVEKALREAVPVPRELVLGKGYDPKRLRDYVKAEKAGRGKNKAPKAHTPRKAAPSGSKVKAAGDMKPGPSGSTRAFKVALGKRRSVTVSFSGEVEPALVTRLKKMVEGVAKGTG